MNDPLPENIDGRKAVAHSVEHRIDWGYVALSLAALVALYTVFVREPDEEGRR